MAFLKLISHNILQCKEGEWAQEMMNFHAPGFAWKIVKPFAVGTVIIVAWQTLNEYAIQHF